MMHKQPDKWTVSWEECARMCDIMCHDLIFVKNENILAQGRELSCECVFKWSEI